MKWLTKHLLGFLIAVCSPVAAGAVELVYSNNFQNPSDPLPEWSPNWLDITPGTASHPADSFLGKFTNQAVTLNLTGLPAHAELEICFDLYAIGRWRGNTVADGAAAPGTWDFRLVDGPVLLATTFSNLSDRQAHPGPYPGGDYPAQAGAYEASTLGYLIAPDPTIRDSVYRLKYVVSHSGPAASFAFSATGLGPLSEESWGIDNVLVATMGIPEPSTFALLGIGALGPLAAKRWQRGRFSRTSNRQRQGCST